MKLLQSTWTVALAGGCLYLGMTCFLLRPSSLLQQGLLAPSAEAATEKSPAWEFSNPEIDHLVSELNKEKAAVGKREQELSELAARLEAERAEITIVTQAVYRLQRDFDRNVLRVQEQEVANLKKLAKTYAVMDPESAASIFRQMEEDQMVKILMYMKENETAPVLQGMARLGEAEAKHAAQISDRLRTAIMPKTTAKP